MHTLRPTLGPVSSVIGAQWGDEGKGKVVDLLAEEYDVIARACGGANAGHTIVVNNQKHVFHLMPSGCLHNGKNIVLGSGLVIHLETLLEEIATLKTHGIDVIDRLHISKEAHIVFDYHKEVDAALEEGRQKTQGGKIGTTKRGIGPAYIDKASRIGIRMEDIGNDLHTVLTDRASWIKSTFNVDIDIEKECAHVRTAKEMFSGRIVDTTQLLHSYQREGKSILIEGAQATLLDIDHGTYPYVTSSSTTLAGALQGLGLPPNSVTSCVGVAKAYCTRVGEGDFPTEAQGETADRLRDRGGEYGATTGRPRRTGWLNIDDLQYGAALNGHTHWNITKLDVLDEEEVIPVMINGITEEAPGWQTSTAGVRSWNDLPENAQKYIELIETHTNVPVAMIGTGQGREDMIIRN